MKKNWKALKNVVEVDLRPYTFDNGAKLMEFSYIGNALMKRVEWLLANTYKGYPYVCVGDYADKVFTKAYMSNIVDAKEKGGVDVYEKATGFEESRKYTTFLEGLPEYDGIPYYSYVINYSKKEYVKLIPYKPNAYKVHPLSLLCAYGNGRGGGDYYGDDEKLVGRWAFDNIGVTNDRKEIRGFKKIKPRFKSEV